MLLEPKERPRPAAAVEPVVLELVCHHIRQGEEPQLEAQELTTMAGMTRIMIT